MKHRLFLTAALAALIALPAHAAELSVAQISTYLNSFTTARADFTQVNGDGSISTGVLAIHRPGRARFDYNEDKTLVIAGGGQVAIFDPVSNLRPEQYPLRRTPLAHVLARTVDLARSGMLVDHRSDGTATAVTLQDPEHPEYGNIQMIFTDAPVKLRQWVITNEFGDQTQVVFEDFQTAVSLGARMFNIPQEIDARGLN